MRRLGVGDAAVVTRGPRPIPVPVMLSVTAAGMTTTAMISPVVPDVLTAYGQDPARAGLVVAAATLPAIVASPFVGVLADRYGRLRVLRPCLAMFGLAGTASALAPGFEWFLAMRFLQGFPTAGLIVLAIVLISDQTQGRERLVLLGRNAAVLTGSLAVFPMIGGAVAAAAGWRATFALYALAPLVLIALRTHVDIPRTSSGPVLTDPEASDPPPGMRAVGTLLRTGRIPFALVSGTITLALGFGWGVTLLPVHAEERLGLGAGPRGLVVGASAVVATIVALGAAAPLARLGLERVMALALGCFGLGWAIVAVSGGSVFGVVVGVAITGFPQGIVLPVLQAVIAAEAPEAVRGTALSLWGMSIRLGQTVGPAVMLVLLVWTTTTGAFVIGAAATLIGGLLLGVSRGVRSPDREAVP